MNASFHVARWPGAVQEPPPGCAEAVERLGWSWATAEESGPRVWLVDARSVSEVGVAALAAAVVVARPGDAPVAWASLETAALDVVDAAAPVDEWVARLSAARRRWESTQAARRAIGLVTHDLNNPLAALRILTELYAMDASEPEQRRDAQDMLEAVDAASVLVEVLHAWGASEPEGAAQEFDVSDVVHQALDRACFRRHMELHPGVLPLLVRGRPAVVREALTQVFWNAKRVTAEGRRFRVAIAGRSVVVVSEGIEFSGDAAALLLEPHGYLALRDQRLPVAPVGLAGARAALAGQGASLVLRAVPAGLEARVSWA